MQKYTCIHTCIYAQIYENISMNLFRISLSIFPPHVYMMSNNNQGFALTGVTPQPQHLELGLAHRMHWIHRTKHLQKQRKLSAQRRANNTDRSMEKSHEINQGLISLRVREIILKTMRFSSPFQTPWRRQIRRAPSSRSQGTVCETSK